MPSVVNPIGRGVRAIDSSLAPNWKLSTTKPIVREFSWKIEFAPTTGTERTYSGVVITNKYQMRWVFTQIVEKRFNDLTLINQSVSDLAVFSLPNVFTSTEFENSKAWQLEQMKIDFDRDLEVYTLVAVLTAKTKFQSRPVMNSKFEVPNFEIVPIMAEVV